MGFRTKIVGLFFIGFSLLSAIGIYLLEKNLKQSYYFIEHQEARENLDQLINLIDDKFAVLFQLTNDWAYWGQMYNFVNHPTDEFGKREISPTALQIIGMDFVLILNKDNDVIYYETADGKRTNYLYEEVIDHVKWRTLSSNVVENHNCGLDRAKKGVALICWQRILGSDHLGNQGGLLIFGRVLDNEVQLSILKNSGQVAQILPIESEDNKTSFKIKPLLDTNSIQFNENSFVLNAKLMNIVGHPVADIQLHYSDSISQLGNEVITKVAVVLLVVMFLNGLVLLTGVHLILIRRLDNMVSEVNEIRKNGQWEGNLALPNKKDEITKLGLVINQMLSFIRQQMASLELSLKTDALTQIANRIAFEQKLAMGLSMTQRDPTFQFALLLMDVDFIKQYNDHYGYSAGDQVLKDIAKLLTQIAERSSWFVARIGGDKFAIILSTESIDNVIEVANGVSNEVMDLLKELKIPHEKSTISAYVTLSVGVSMAVSTDDVSSLISRVEKGAHQAKQAGRNRVVVI